MFRHFTHTNIITRERHFKKSTFELLDISLMSNYNGCMDKTDAISLISKIRNANNRYIETQMESHGIHGIATSHGDILFTLFYNKQLTMAGIAKKIDKDKSTVTALISKLVKLGYVKKDRDPKDSRIVYVSLTDEGKKLQPIFEAISDNLVAQFYNGITSSESEQFFKTLAKLYLNMQ